MKISHQASISDKLKKGLSDKGITTRSIVAFVIFGIIVLVFVLSDLTGRHGNSMGAGLAAEVNGEIISVKDFTEEESRLSQYYAQLFGGQFDIESQKGLLRGEVMNSIVTKVLTAQAAEKEGIYATDAEVRHMITQELPYFKRDGQFQSELYKNILTANRMTPGEFEKKLRQEIKNQRSRQLFDSSLVVSDLQKAVENELRSSKLNLEFVQLSAVDFAFKNKSTDSQIASELAKPEFSKKVESYFKTNESKYETDEQVRASHILIKAKPGEEAVALQKIQALRKRLEKEDFAKLAAQVSEDPGSKAKNGDLGFFNRGKMVKEFDEVAFALPIGKISDPVKSNFGFHLVKVTDKKAYVKADFSKVRMEIARNIFSEEAYSIFIKSVESALGAGKTDEALKLIADVHIQWKETGFFDLASEVAPVMNSTQALKMGLELTKAQPLAKRLVREGDSQFLIRLKETKIESADLKSPRQNQELLERQRSSEAFRSWIEEQKKSSSIETNTALLQIQQ